MASYHLSVKTIKRSAGRSATAAAAYRAGERIDCQREGRVHDYTAKQGVEDSFIVAPEHAPDWAQDRAALWNAAEAHETRKNSVTAREWELALPSELGAEERAEITRAFAEQLVERYGVAVDVAIHAPHRDGDQRNHHAHLLTSTRRLEAEGFTEKTRVLDAAKTGGVEIEAMRRVWAELQNRALERAGEVERVDHRSLEAQREAALERGDAALAEALDRAPEVKLGPAANAMERQAMRAAVAEGRDYEPVTERGRAVHAARLARTMVRELQERVDRARETYGAEREAGQGRVSAGLAALRAAAEKERNRDRDGDGQPRGQEDIRARLSKIVGREGGEKAKPERSAPAQGRESVRDRLSAILDRSKPVEVERDGEEQERDDERQVEKDRGRDLDSGGGWSL